MPSADPCSVWADHLFLLPTVQPAPARSSRRFQLQQVCRLPFSPGAPAAVTNPASSPQRRPPSPRGPGPRSQQALQEGSCAPRGPPASRHPYKACGPNNLQKAWPCGPHSLPNRTAPSPNTGAQGQQATGDMGGRGPTRLPIGPPAETPSPSKRRRCSGNAVLLT
ncbi:hypothetical protein NDU88_000439 [Pleurodeles waltl]|uniref:Uncharacterized protein n=1 Tax=Pleurodeles waltl TaxID=8319 RepID=A0AAV7UTD1_PLEWA|nr:hypothetical protein NDU88_000439 [Pleurodeles waltl]